MRRQQLPGRCLHRDPGPDHAGPAGRGRGHQSGARHAPDRPPRRPSGQRPRRWPRPGAVHPRRRARPALALCRTGLAAPLHRQEGFDLRGRRQPHRQRSG
ncbi:hypothetical protein G6F62_015360 [Rhizopus arrhizus]|nr:hypothetical protein G6F62_015360 [Rhizopus arrhizus]